MWKVAHMFLALICLSQLQDKNFTLHNFQLFKQSWLLGSNGINPCCTILWLSNISSNKNHHKYLLLKFKLRLSLIEHKKIQIRNLLLINLVKADHYNWRWTARQILRPILTLFGPGCFDLIWVPGRGGWQFWFLQLPGRPARRPSVRTSSE